MEAREAYERIFRDTQGAISILSLMAEHMTGQAVDPRLVSTVEAVAHMLDSNQGAFDAIDWLIRRMEFLAEVEQYTDEQMDAMCQDVTPDDVRYQACEEDLPPEDQDEVCDDYPEDDEIFIDDDDYQVSCEPMDPDELPPEED